MRRALSKSPRGGEEAAFCVCAWRVGGRQRCSRSGGTFHADFELFGRFSFLSPGVGPASGVGDAPQWRHRAAVPGPELFGMSAPCLTNLQKLCGTKQTPAFYPEGVRKRPASASPEAAPALPPQQDRAGTCGDTVAPAQRVCETKNKPRRTTAWTVPRGEANQPQGTIAALLSKALDSALLLYNLSSVDFWTFPPPPGHQERATALGGCWPCREAGWGGGYSPTSACIGHALPRQEVTSSMQQVPSWVLGLDSEPCRSLGGAVVGAAALAHGAPLSPQAGCPSTTLLSPREALDGRAPPVWGWCLLGLWEGGWEMLCLHPPSSGAGCCNITCSFGPKWGTELTTNNVQLLNVFCQKERKIKPCCKELLQAWSHWHPPCWRGIEDSGYCHGPLRRPP